MFADESTDSKRYSKIVIRGPFNIYNTCLTPQNSLFTLRENSTWLTGFHLEAVDNEYCSSDCQLWERFLRTLLTEKWENVSVLFGDLNKRKEALQAFSFLNKKKREEMVCIEETSNREKSVKAKDLLEIGLRDGGTKISDA
ncbi:hypothetical protein TNCT_308581 [Trichonephila clavata]|uniref:Uncharacterized protein n=1 Tax=Trichonephila clavata TaxID=2740835 RepID=A0A8X6FHJ9_TRICU|nr:hypothetical protein TNCT_308581 [Trichonephila clavata]